MYVLMRRLSRSEIKPMVLDGAYIALKNQVIKAERRILKELGFCVHVKHPHKVYRSRVQTRDFTFNCNNFSSTLPSGLFG